MVNEKRLDLIDRNVLEASMCKQADMYGTDHLFIDVIIYEIDTAPTVDAEVVKYGRWIVHNKGQNNWVECSECNTVGSPFWKRCPVCEAKMRCDEND